MDGEQEHDKQEHDKQEHERKEHDAVQTAGMTVADLARILAALPAPASAAELINEVRELEDMKCALAARQARLTVAFDLAQRREQADAGMPADQLGAGVAAQIALARRESPARGTSASRRPS
jgi:hypothetical protein